MENLSIDQFKRCLPSNLKGNVTEEIVERFNEVLNDPVAREAIQDNLIGFTNVISQGKLTLWFLHITSLNLLHYYLSL